MNEPLPSLPPGGTQCFNCGKEVQTNAAFCPHCGAPLPTQGSGFTIALRLIGALLLGGLALLFGAAGACFMLFSLNSGGLGFIGLILLVFAALCIQGVIALTKKRGGN